MTRTITTHNGGQSCANRMHNNRTERVTSAQEHIDPILSANNEYWLDIAPRRAYEDIFGEALKKYNSDPRRISDPRRQIEDYYTHIRKDKERNAVYELIIQVGDRDDTGIIPENTQTERAILKEFYETWEQRNPNLKLIGAYLHADEIDGTVHAHLNYIPVSTLNDKGEPYKRGLSVQNGLNGALAAQGYGTYKKVNKNKETGAVTWDTPQIRWETAQNAALEEICRKHGIEVEHPLTGDKHKSTPKFKADKIIENSKKIISAKDNVSVEITDFMSKNKKAALKEEKAAVAVISADNEYQQQENVRQASINALRHQQLNNKAEQLENIGKNLVKKEYDLECNKFKYQNLYDEQLDLNNIFNKLKEDFIFIKSENKFFEKENTKLKVENEKFKDDFSKIRQVLLKIANFTNNITKTHYSVDVYETIGLIGIINNLIDKSIDSLKQDSEDKKILSSQNRTLIAQNEEYLKTIYNLKEINEEALKRLVDTVKAIGMIKYDNKDGYKVENLIQKQQNLVDGISNSIYKWAKSIGYNDIAKTVDTEIGISDNIKKEINLLTPKSRDYGYGSR